VNHSPQCNFHGGRISRLQSFLYVQAPTLARPPDCTHRCSLPQGGRAVYTTQWTGSYLPRTVASLRVRFGQLTRRDFHPLDYGLVGRYTLGFLPSHRDDRFPRSSQEPKPRSRRLYAEHHPGNKQAPPGLLLGFCQPPVSILSESYFDTSSAVRSRSSP
jgi:hypothetical protein